MNKYIKYAYSINTFDTDAVSWSLEGLRAGGYAWGSGSDVLISGCCTSVEEATMAIKDAVKKYAGGASVTRLPF